MLVRITLNLHVDFGGVKSYIVSFHQKMGYEFSFVQTLFYVLQHVIIIKAP